MALTVNYNVYSTALRAVELSGWQVNTESYLIRKNCECTWVAKNGLETLYASNPIELLGLVKIFEIKEPKSFEPYWWEIEGERSWMDYLPQDKNDT